MHRIDTDGHVGNQFNEGDPLVPRLPTQIDKHWLNAVQEELVSIVLDAASGIGALVKGTNNQVLAALRAILVNRTTAQTIAGAKTFTSALSAAAGISVDQSAAPGADLVALEVTGKGTGRAANFNGGADGGGIAATGFGAGTGVIAQNTAGTGYGLVVSGKTAAPARAAMRIIPQDTPPTTPLIGDLYVTTAGVLRIYNGSAWVSVGSQT